MKGSRPSLLRVLVLAVGLTLFPLSSFSQTSVVQPLITQPINAGNLVTLSGNTHPLAQLQFDVGPAPASLPLNRMLLVLKRSPQQESALRQLIDDHQDKSSPNYHRWLTPDEFGQQFGPADTDIQTITFWLQSQGFTVSNVSRGRSVVEFSGTAGQVRAAFNTAIHGFLVNGAQHWANASDPQIPAALAPVIAGVDSLNNFPKKPMSQFVGTYSVITRKLTSANPQFTFAGGCDQDNNCYALVPFDFATIYNVLPLWNTTPTAIDGSGETIAIVGRSNINIQDVRDFRNLFGLPAKDPQIILNGPDPGLNGDESEQDIDVQWSGAVAKNATIDLVVSQSTETTDGVDLSAEYIVDNNLASVMSASYGLCEQALGAAGNQFYNAIWEQAAAQGITVMVSSGDNGSAGCDFNQGFAPQPAQSGLAVNGIASTPFNVAVGGTDFNDFFNPQTYWNLTNDPTTQASAKGYIPEITWDDSCTNFLFAQVGFSSNAETNCNNSQLAGNVITVGGSGGLSTLYSQPAWQTGTGVQAGKRNLPDVSLFSSDGFLGNFYVICQSDITGGICSTSNFAGFGGTSVASPAFAGIMALVNQQMGARQGNPNYVLYKLAATQSPANCNSSSTTGPAATCIFNDITQGTIAMPCATGSPNCTTATAGHQFGVLSGYGTTAAYDRATGLGSVNANNLVTKWNTVTFRPSTTALTLSPTTGLTHGQSVTVSGTVAPGNSPATPLPTGDVALVTSTGQAVGGFKLSAGSFSGTTNLLPGGTYTVTANYGGDGTYGGSASSPPVSMTINPENSKTTLRMLTFDNLGNLISSNATTAVYGSPYLLRVDVTNSAGATCGPLGGCPTGNVALTDNGAPLDLGTFTLNTLGYFEDQLVQLNGGAHTVQASYAGDSSFNPSSAGSVFTITLAPTSIAAPFAPDTAVGAQTTLAATVQTQSSGAAPTGTVTFLANGTPLAGTTTYFPAAGSAAGGASLVANLSTQFSAPGTFNITATYSGDGNYAASSSPNTVLKAQFATTGTIQASPQNPAAGTTVTVTATVGANASSPPPTGSITFTISPFPVTTTVPVTAITDANGHAAGQATTTFNPTVNETVFATYSGDSNYQGVNSMMTSVSVPGTDFALFPATDPLTVAAGQSVVEEIGAATQQDFRGIISLSACSRVPAEATCTVTVSTIVTPTNGQVTITTTGPHTVAENSNVPRGFAWWGTTLGMGLAAVVFLGSANRRRRGGLLSLIVLGVLLITPGCGGGAGGGGGHLDPGTPKGTYTITVTGTAGSITHTTTFKLTVQ